VVEKERNNFVGELTEARDKCITLDKTLEEKLAALDQLRSEKDREVCPFSST
jgi:hypothetical protein